MPGDPDVRVQSREEKNTRKALDRAKKFTVQYRTRNEQGHVNTRLARNSLLEAKTQFDHLTTLVNKSLHTIVNRDPPPDEAVIDAYDTAWDKEIGEFQVWYDENHVAIEDVVREEDLKLVKMQNVAPRQNLVHEYNALKDIITEKVARLKASIPEKLSLPVYQDLKGRHKDVETQIEHELRDLALRINNLLVEDGVDYVQTYQADRVDLQKSFQEMVSITIGAVEQPMTSTPNVSMIGQHQSQVESSQESSSGQRSMLTYQKRNPPKFTGDIRAFPRWFEEWTTVIRYQVKRCWSH